LLSQIVIPKNNRKQGVGTSVMNEVIKYADDHKLRIRLTPDNSIGGSSINRLKSFYKRFGFIENKGSQPFSETMYRNPK
jgi:predicted GNAT family N-acyltransferase